MLLPVRSSLQSARMSLDKRLLKARHLVLGILLGIAKLDKKQGVEKISQPLVVVMVAGARFELATFGL